MEKYRNLGKRVLTKIEKSLRITDKHYYMTMKRNSIYRMCHRERPSGERSYKECIEPALESLYENAAHISVTDERVNCRIQVYGLRLIRVVPPIFRSLFGSGKPAFFVSVSYQIK